MVVRVKICGITREADVDSAVSSGADAVGFISGFPASPRNISLERAGELARRVPPFVSAVLVTTEDLVLGSESEVRRTGIGTIQLYGDGVDPGRVRSSLGVRLIRPYLMRSEETHPAKAASEGFDALLTDTYRAGRQGGTGIISDWEVCGRIRDEILPVRMILSGGLRPENVAEGIKLVRPFAVDVSSGVESSPGIKDPDKIAEFIRRAREADSR
jgi:phosphoribosylanthranilate isomerase